MTLKLPEIVKISGRLFGSFTKQLVSPERLIPCRLEPFTWPRSAGFRATTPDGMTIAIIDKKTTSSCNSDAVLLVDSAGTTDAIALSIAAGRAKWLHPRPVRPPQLSIEDAGLLATNAAASWAGSFSLHAEEYRDEQLVRPGLRPPQVGAVHAALAHWSVSSSPATIVMPTGTGKTETMLALLVAVPIPRLLVVVPNDQLRSQIALKFIGLGILKSCECLKADAMYPTVSMLRQVPKSTTEIDQIFLRSNVIVSTMQILSRLSAELQARAAEHVTDLFVDEAHHIGARTWSAFKSHFRHRRILQFTATPFRNDGRRVDGRFIYVYPLSKAQEEQLFKPISFLPIQGLDREQTDDMIIAKVGETLAADQARGYNHLVMARAENIERATALHAKYVAHLPHYRPLLIHSQMGRLSRDEALTALQSMSARIVVCVDMLGEGFDLPELKIAALHDKHKSEAVTLQFIGRFTRTRRDLGDATVLASVAIDEVGGALRALYAEDADWNRVLSVIGATRTAKEVRREEVFQGFSELPERFPLETLFPRMSTVVYRTTCEAWQPSAIESVFPPGGIVEGPYYNEAERLVIFVTRDEERIRWATVKTPVNVTYNLYLVHWNVESALLFINSSNLGELHGTLAKAVAGEDAGRIGGEEVFRVLDGFRRLVLTNLGVSETQRKPVRYSMFMGTDIADQLDTLPGNRNRTKTNIFGQGFTNDGKCTIGCSVKGKIWSYEATNNFGEWIDWCESVGRKLLDNTITTEGILRRLVRPKRQMSLPQKPPIAIAWPEGFLIIPEERLDIDIDGTRAPFYDCEIALEDASDTTRIVFRVGTDMTKALFELSINQTGVHYTPIGSSVVTVHLGRRERALVDVLTEDPPHIYYADGDMLVGAELFMLPRDEERPAFDVEKIEALNWAGIDIRKESQGAERWPDSVQRFVIERQLQASEGYDVVFDDDGSGEVADVVAMRLSGQTLKVDMFHCKYSTSPTPGARVADLYEVCGQAQKSIRWRERPGIFLKHLQKREGDRWKANARTRYEKGSAAVVNGWLNRWRELSYDFSATIVQPGYSKAATAAEHLELFAATESLLMETWGMRFRVWASP